MSNKKLAICIKKNKKIKNFEIDENFLINNFNNEFVFSLPIKIKDSNLKEIERECDFDYKCDKKNFTISIFAWNEGKEGNQNLFDLPPPIDTQLYYHNIYAVAHKNNKIRNFTISDFNKFYEKSFGGFEDLGSEDSWSEEESNPSDADENGDLIGFIDNSEIIENKLTSESEYEYSESDD